MLSAGDAQRVAGLMRETAAAELLPRFRNLAKGEIREKRPGDVVTVADVASEQRLAVGLAKILPGVPVVGEEAVEQDPGLVDLIGRPGERCWVVDPLDGTFELLQGLRSLCHDHLPDRGSRDGWRLDPRRAQRPDGDRPQRTGRHAGCRPVAGRPSGQPLRGLVAPRVHREFDRQLAPAQRTRLGQLSTLKCAGREYIEMLSGTYDFNLYRRTKPWDHAAGALMLSEAGGRAIRLKGTPYGPDQPINLGIISAPSVEAVAEAKALYEMVEMPLLASAPAPRG